MRAGWSNNSLLKMGDDGCFRWGRWASCGNGGRRRRAHGRQRRSLGTGGLIIIALKLILLVMETCHCIRICGLLYIGTLALNLHTPTYFTPLQPCDLSQRAIVHHRRIRSLYLSSALLLLYSRTRHSLLYSLYKITTTDDSTVSVSLLCFITLLASLPQPSIFSLYHHPLPTCIWPPLTAPSKYAPPRVVSSFRHSLSDVYAPPPSIIFARISLASLQGRAQNPPSENPECN